MKSPTLRRLALTLALGVTAAPSALADANKSDGSQVEAWIAEQHAAGRIASASVAHIQGAAVEISGHGAVDGDQGAKPDADTQYQIGSINKVFTKLLLAESVAAGTVAYDTALGSLLPESFKPSNPAIKSITLESLALHHSGLPRLPANLDPSNAVNPYGSYDETRLLSGLAIARANQPLGRFYSYSNFGSGLLGHVLGKAHGEGYRAAVMRDVLQPLGLQRTAFAPDANAAKAFSAGKQVPPWEFQDAFAGIGALWGSVSDLARLVQAYLGAHEHQLQHALGHDLQIHADADAFEVTRVWHVARANGKPIYWHNGGTGGFRSFVGFRTDDRRGIAILVSGDADPTNIGLAALGATPSQPEPRQVDASVFGQYQLSRDFGIGVYHDSGKLVAQASGQAPLKLHALGDDWYAIAEVDAAVRFVREEDQVSALELVQNGMVQRALRSADTASSQRKQAQ